MKKLYSTVIAAIAVVVVASLVLAAQAPSITLQTVLDAFNRIPPVWSQVLPVGERFVLVMSGEAVLDKETGLVWEQAPVEPASNWINAHVLCNVKGLGNRRGWRLPTFSELASLIDTANPTGNPDLPANHPFTNVQNAIYWSASTAADETTLAWEVNFNFGNSAGGPEKMAKDQSNFVWCVRGGIGADPK
jgi:hypothetical protein